jgi:catechol 2,3-dioxygenase-like lactoylglutathione lyase family enzyme
MIDHVGVRVQDFPKLLAFYRAALAPIGYEVVMEYPGAAGLGAQGKPDLWLMQTDKTTHPTHIALSSSRDRIGGFHAASLAAGGVDNGAPGLRADYHPNYYAAFVLDPEGNNIEVVCHESPDVPKVKAKAKSARPAGKAKAKAKGTKAPPKQAKKQAKKSTNKKATNKKR